MTVKKLLFCFLAATAARFAFLLVYNSVPYDIAELSFNGVVKFKVTLVKVSTTSTVVCSTVVESLHKKSMKDWNLKQL